MFSQYSDLGAFMTFINVLGTETSLENPEFDFSVTRDEVI